MKFTCKSFVVRPAADGMVEIEAYDATIMAGAPNLDITTAAARLGVSRNTLTGLLERRPDLARRVGKDGKIVIPEGNLDKLLVPYTPQRRVRIETATTTRTNKDTRR